MTDVPEDDVVVACPYMMLVPGMVMVPETSLDNMGDAQGVVIGAQNVEQMGRVLFIGLRAKDGSGMVAAIPPNSWELLAETLNTVMGGLAAGDFDQPETAQ